MNSLYAVASFALNLLAATDIGTGVKAIGVGIAILTAAGAGIAIGLATSKAVEAIGRQPEAESKIRSSLMLGLVFSETIAIYALLAVILIVFMVN